MDRKTNRKVSAVDQARKRFEAEYEAKRSASSRMDEHKKMMASVRKSAAPGMGSAGKTNSASRSMSKVKKNITHTGGATSGVSKLPYTGGKAKVSKLPNTGGAPTMTKYGSGASAKMLKKSAPRSTSSASAGNMMKTKTRRKNEY